METIKKILPIVISLALCSCVSSKNFKELMTDSYGNYFVQKLIQSCSANQRLFILRHVFNDFVEIGINPSGTHSLQSIIQIINLKDEEEVLKCALNGNVFKLSFNSNGTHIIQKIISCFEEEKREFLNDFIIENLSKMCNNANGISVIQKFINQNRNEDVKSRIIKQFQKECLEIVQDPYGNYAIQYAFDTFGTVECKRIIEEVLKNEISLSMQKFSSNVVEKCLEICENVTFKKAITELFNPSGFISLFKNKYAGFVINKAIKIMNSEEKVEIKDILLKIQANSAKDRAKLNHLIDVL